MTAPRLLLSLVVVASLASASGDNSPVDEAANRVEQSAAKTPGGLGLEFRMLAAQALQQRHPDLARKFVDATLEELRAGKDLTVGPGVIQALAAIAPSEAVSVLPQAAPRALPMLIAALARSNHADAALALYRDALARGQVRVTAAAPVLAALAKEKPAEAARLFQEIPAAFSFEPLEPSDGWWLINAAGSVASAAPGLAADVYERIIQAASAPGYGAKSSSTIQATFQIGSATVSTSSRDTLLLAAGSRLRSLAPDRFEKYKPVFAPWDFSGSVTLKGFRSTPAGAPLQNAAEAAAIQQRLGQIRGLPTDAERARVVIELATQIRALPAGVPKLGLARGLCSLSTEGDLGKEALGAVASTFAQAMREGAPSAADYLELASLVRYEHVPAPASDAALDAGAAVLALREQLVAENGFALTDLNGKTHTLSALRGRVVLLNFWATWCPPCRKEMPDMEKLHQRFAAKGLTVLAVSDEERAKVADFIQKQKYTFTILLDPDRKVNTAFSVEGIPKSFLFDRDGKLVAHAIDMRTERQFLEMLKQVGLE